MKKIFTLLAGLIFVFPQPSVAQPSGALDVAVTVMNHQGEPVAGAKVGASGSILQPQVTDSVGRALLSLEAGRQAINFSVSPSGQERGGEARFTTTILVSAANPNSVQLRLPEITELVVNLSQADSYGANLLATTGGSWNTAATLTANGVTSSVSGFQDFPRLLKVQPRGSGKVALASILKPSSRPFNTDLDKDGITDVVFEVATVYGNPRKFTVLSKSLGNSIESLSLEGVPWIEVTFSSPAIARKQISYVARVMIGSKESSDLKPNAFWVIHSNPVDAVGVFSVRPGEGNFWVPSESAEFILGDFASPKYVSSLIMLEVQQPVPAPKPIKYKSCATLQKVYAGGVALSSKYVNKGGKIKMKPTVNTKVYNLNKSLDRDKDGLACER